MKKIFCTSILIFLFTSICFGQYAWTKLTDFPSTRYKPTAFTLDNKGYVFGGLTPQQYQNDLWEFDPTKNTWIQTSAGREGAVSFTINNKAYVCGGVTNEGGVPELWEFDPVQNKWENKTSIPVSLITSFNLVAFSAKGKGYVRASYNENDFWEYDPDSNSWSKKSNLAGSIESNMVGFSILDRGYIGTGNLSSEFWEYNPSTDKWSRKADFAGDGRLGAVGFVIGDKGYIGLGNIGGEDVTDFWKYDPSENSWYQVDSCGYAASHGFGFSIGKVGYVGTGIFTESGEFWGFDSQITCIKDVEEVLSNQFELKQNYPNPFNPSTTIVFTITSSQNVRLEIFNSIGQRVKLLIDSELEAGKYKINYEPVNLSSGIYFYSLKCGKTVKTKKMLYLK